RAIGHPYASLRADGTDIAVLEASVRYVRPVHFDDVLSVHLAPVAATRTTFEIDYLLTIDGVVRSHAVTAHACVNARGRPTRLPPWLVELAVTGSSHR
ncbi:MAG: acyl-CoA thioesterase, partial [Acidimicrobiia bacterium]